MPIDPRISLGVQPLQVADPMARYGQMQNILAAQSQQQMSQMQLENMQRDRDALTKMQAEITKNGGPADLTAASTQMIQSGIPHYMDLGFKIQERLQNQKNFEGLLKGGAAPTTMPSVAPAPGALGSGTFDPTASPAPVANQLAPAAAPPAAAPVNQLSPDTAALRRQIDAAYALGTPQALAWAQAREKELGEMTKPQVVAAGSSVYVPGKGFVATATEKTPAPPAMVAEYEYAKTPAGGGFKGSYQQFVTARAAASRAPAQPTAPVAVIDPITKQPIYVSREEALRNKMQPAANAPALKPLTEGQEIKLRTDVGKDYKAATTALSQMDDLLDSIDAVKTAPGLTAATGFTGKYLPSFPEGKAAQAETRIANLRGKVTALGKATAAMSGAIGSIANQEWKILADQIAALDEVKGAGPLLEQIGLVEQQTRGAIARIRDTYEKTRAEDFERFPQFRDLPQSRRAAEPAASGTGGFKYLGKEGG